MNDQPTLSEKIRGLRLAAQFRPKQAILITVLNILSALSEGVGIGLLLPVIETAQSEAALTTELSGFTAYISTVYRTLGVPLSLESLIIGLAMLVFIRYNMSFIVSWLQLNLTTGYHAHLRERCYEALMRTRISYVEKEDSDEITNIIITETAQSSDLINQMLGLIQTTVFIGIYTAIAVLIAPVLTAITVIALGIVVVFMRYVVQPGFSIGDDVVNANEEIQSLVNAGVRGLREIKLFNMVSDIISKYNDAHHDLVQTRIRLGRNRALLSNFNQLFNSLVFFILIYIAIARLNISFASLGVFLISVYRLSPMISTLNNRLYSIDGQLPHLLRTHDLISELSNRTDPDGHQPAPGHVTDICLKNVSFEYSNGGGVRDISLSITEGETIALAGPSGAGKTTILSLITRMYEPDSGQVLVNDTPLEQITSASWNRSVAIVPQRPYIFNDTLRYNLTIGNMSASPSEIKHACEISQVSAFLDELPEGLESQLGDDGVRLSGGQRQRVAIARALITDADVLLLDEATSELDSPTEATILSGIESMDREYLTVVIGHWFSAVQDADRIYTVVDGTVVEEGTHEELISTESYYARLYGDQSQETVGENKN